MKTRPPSFARDGSRAAAAALVALVGIAQLAATASGSSLTGKQSPPSPAASLHSQRQEVAGNNQAAAAAADQTKQARPQPVKGHHAAEGTKQRSASDEHDDAVPLATVNNHSRNNQNLLRPPQYVDVSALMGSGGANAPAALAGMRNLTSTGGAFAGAGQGSGPGSSTSTSAMFSHNTISANSLLTPKSRSGLPECANQQVCNAIFVRMNYTQRLCECANWKCSNTLDPQDGHTIELTRKFDKRIYTQIKTCEPLRDVRACKAPTDWTLLALQSERSGKAHYVVVCRCPTWAQLEGPYTHNHPPYANIPGIRVYGMLCAHQTARSSAAQTYSAYNPALNIYPEFPWSEALNVLNTTNLASQLDAMPH